jgi:hypothetical protein
MYALPEIPYPKTQYTFPRYIRYYPLKTATTCSGKISGIIKKIPFVESNTEQYPYKIQYTHGVCIII